MKSPTAVKISYAACPDCQVGHPRTEACAKAKPVVEEVTVPTIRNRARKRKGPTYTFALTRQQRKAIFKGESPRITVPHGKSPFEPGSEYKIPGSRNIWLGITGIEEGKERDTILYVRYDERSRLLRASVHGVDFDAMRRRFDEHGYLSDAGEDDAEIKVLSAEESAYTSSPGASLRLEKEAISREEQDRMTRESREGRPMRRQQAIAKVKAALAGMEENPDFNEDQGNVRHLRRTLARMEENPRAGNGAEVAA